MRRPAFWMGMGSLVGLLLGLLLADWQMLFLPALLLPLFLLCLFLPKNACRKWMPFLGSAFLSACFLVLFLSLSLLPEHLTSETEEPVSATFCVEGELDGAGGAKGYLVRMYDINDETVKSLGRVVVYTNRSLPLFEVVKGEVVFFPKTSLWETLVQTNGCVASAYLPLYEDSDLVSVPSTRPFFLQQALYSLRQQVKSAFETHSPTYGGILLGASTGDTSLLSSSDLHAFRRSGIAHLFAVSGLHLSLLCGSILSFLKGRRVRPWLIVVVGLPLVWGMALLAGFSYSVLRAAGMLTLSLLGQLFDRRYDGLNGLGVIVLVLLIADPFAVSDAGFLLSVAASVGILSFATPLSCRICRRLRLKNALAKKLVAAFSVALSAFLVVLPVSVFFFDAVTLVSPFTNLIAAFVAPFLVVLALILALLFLVGAPLPLIGLFLLPAEGFALVLQKIGQFFADLPLAFSLESETLRLPVLFLSLAAVGAFFFWRRISFRRVLSFFLVLCVGFLSCTVASYSRTNQTDRLFLCQNEKGVSLTLTSGGKTFLYVDTMTPSDRMVPLLELRRRNFDQIDLLVLPNPNAKTVYTLDLLTNEYKVDCLLADCYLPFTSARQLPYGDFAAKVGNFDVYLSDMGGAQAIAIHTADFSFLLVEEAADCDALVQKEGFDKLFDLCVFVGGPPKEQVSLQADSFLLASRKAEEEHTICPVVDGCLSIELFAGSVSLEMTP